MSTLDIVFQQLVNGLILGSFYSLVALGYSMVYGIIKLLNFAHGDIYMVGSFLGLILLAVALLSVYPTVRFFGWRRSLGAAEGPAISPGQARRLRLILRIELLLLAFLPLLGVLLVLRRMPLLGLAIPEAAGCGQAAALS